MEPRTVALPISKVVCLEDRAQVERRGELQLPAGVHTVEVDGVAPVAVPRSLSVELSGGVLADAKLVHRWRARPKATPGPDASALEQHVAQLQVELATEMDAITRHSAQRQLAQTARATLLATISEASGHGQADAAQWRTQLAEVNAVLDRAEESLRLSELARADTSKRLEKARGARHLAEPDAPELECTLRLIVTSTGAPISVRASYLVPCAAWRPAYRATLRGTELTLECEAVVWQRTGEAWPHVTLACSTARPTLGTSPPELTPDWLSTREKYEAEKRAVAVRVREEVIQTTGEGGSSAVPGVDDGGETRLLAVTAPVTVPSDGQPHRLPLSRFTTQATLARTCPAELTPLVSLVARFPNAGSHVLLAGPVELVRDSGTVGRGTLGFVAVGETAKLSFGSDDGLRVVRRVTREDEEARLTGRRTTTTTVRLFVSNMGAGPAAIEVLERLPVSEVKEVEVQLLPKKTSPLPADVSKEGVARFQLEVPAHGQKDLVLAWELSSAAKVQGL